MKTIKQMIITSVTIFLLTVTASFAMAQEDATKGKPTTGGQMKEAGKETGKAAKSLGSNVKHGRVVRGGKHFGKHMGHAGKNVGRGTKKAATATADTTKEVTKEGAEKTEDIADKTADKTKSVAKATARGTKKVARKTVKGTKKVGSAIKKAVTP